MTLDLTWPWIGAAAAVLLLTLLFFTPVFRVDRRIPRWHDTAWLAVLGLPLYMLHQIEEHGVDLLGAHYAFRGTLCALVDVADPATCRIPYSFITAVNVGTVWGALALGAVLGRHRPLMALSAYGIPLVNAVSHIGQAVREHAYNPGLLTAIVLFLPVGVWALSVGYRAGIRWSGVIGILAAGVLSHAILMGSLIAYLHARIALSTLDTVQLLNALVPLSVAFLVSGLFRTAPHDSS